MITWVVLLLLLLYLLAWGLTRTWWLHDADVEQVVGLLVLTLAASSLIVSAVMLSLDSWSPFTRALTSLGMVIVALAAASKSWTLRALRWFGVLAVVLVSLIVLNIGRDQLALDSAVRGIHELEAIVEALNSLDAPSEDLPDKLEGARIEAVRGLGTAISEVGRPRSDLVTRAENLRLHLVAGLVEEARSDLEEVEAAYEPKTAMEEETSLRDAALAALVAAEAEPPDRALVEKAIQGACAIGIEDGVDPESLPESVPCAVTTNGDTLDVAMAIVRLRLAVYRLAVLGREEDAAAIETLTADLGEVQAAAGNQQEPTSTFVDAFRRGGEAVVADFPGQRDEFPLYLEVVGWTLLAALLLAGWRVIERRSRQQMPGPVTINPGIADPGSSSSEGKGGAIEGPASPKDATSGSNPGLQAVSSGDSVDAQRTVFRVALLRNLDEPSVTPGAEAFSSVTDLTELGGPTGTLLATIASAVKSILSKPGGYIVSSDVLAPGKKDESWRVLVRVSDQTTGKQVAVESVTGASPSAACRAAGYWAAADILSRSSRIPGWLGWGVDAAESLAAFHDASRLPVRDLERALARVPTSGQLLNELGGRYEIERRHLDALELYARASSVHPRHFVGRYRMAVSIGSIRDDIEAQWFGPSISKRLSVAGELSRACKRLRVDVNNLEGERGLQELPGMSDPEVTAVMLRRLALRLLDRLEGETSRVQLIARALRRSERVIWWPKVWSIPNRFGPASRDEWLVRSARLMERDRDLKRVEKRASNPRSWWQLSYNLACYYARQDKPLEAERWLEIALARPGSGQMGDGWLEVDPDLKSLRGSPRFERVAARISIK